jgi:hypothetical protein
VLEKLVDPPQLLADSKLALTSGVYAHGYAMIECDGSAATIGYFQDDEAKPFFTERLGAMA